MFISLGATFPSYAIPKQRMLVNPSCGLNSRHDAERHLLSSGSQIILALSHACGSSSSEIGSSEVRGRFDGMGQINYFS